MTKNVFFLILLILSSYTYVLMSRSSLRAKSYEYELIEEAEDESENVKWCPYKTNVCNGTYCTKKCWL